MKLVVAFNRNRDSYQVPVALQEAGQLEGLVTDFFLPSFCGKFSSLRRRTNDALPWARVHWDWRAIWLQLKLIYAQKSIDPQSIFSELDVALSIRAGKIALKTGADFLLYSGYAKEAFEMVSGTNTRKILFVYHPHAHGSSGILASDVASFPEMMVSHQWHVDEAKALDGTRLDAEIGEASALMCASKFTLNSIPAELRQKKPAFVIPYGCEIPSQKMLTRRLGATRFVFVGQGVQRKGIHHLLRAWQQAERSCMELTLVCGKCDPYILERASVLGIKIIRKLSDDELNELYRHSDVLVMPSLVEGFGLVYLEALAHGCHVIGTTNTGLPDLELPAFAAQTISPGDIEALGHAINWVGNAVRAGEISRKEICRVAATHSWARFRRGINEASAGLES